MHGDITTSTLAFSFPVGFPTKWCFLPFSGPRFKLSLPQVRGCRERSAVHGCPNRQCWQLIPSANTCACALTLLTSLVSSTCSRTFTFCAAVPAFDCSLRFRFDLLARGIAIAASTLSCSLSCIVAFKLLISQNLCVLCAKSVASANVVASIERRINMDHVRVIAEHHGEEFMLGTTEK